MEDEKFQQTMTEVVEEITSILFDGLKDVNGVRAEDAIAAAAGLAGCYLLKDSAIDFSKLTPGSKIEAEAMNDMGPRLLTLMQGYADGFGLNGEEGWDKGVPDEHKPQDIYPLIQKFEPQTTSIFDRHSIPADIRAGFMALAAVRFIADAKDILPEEIGKSLALDAMITGSRTVPPR